MYEILWAVKEDEPIESTIESIRSLPGSRSDIVVTILNVFEEFEVSDDTGKVSSEPFYDEEDVPDAVRDARAALESVAIDVAVRREHGKPAGVIVEVAEELDVDAIYMGGRKRTAVGKVIFGSVTQAVLLNASRTVTVNFEE